MQKVTFSWLGYAVHIFAFLSVLLFSFQSNNVSFKSLLTVLEPYLFSCSSADSLSMGVCLIECASPPSSSFCFRLCCRLWISLSSCQATRVIREHGAVRREWDRIGRLPRVTTDNNSSSSSGDGGSNSDMD